VGQGLHPSHESPGGSQKSIDNDIEIKVEMKIDIREIDSLKA